MDNIKVKRGVGRPRIYTDKENRTHRTTYMLNKKWYCDICETNRNYTLAGKWCHLKTQKHKTNEKIFHLRQKLEQQASEKIDISQLMQQIINICKLL